MKALFNLILVCTAGFALSACSTGLGDFDGEPPYAQERTATHEQMAKPPMPAPAAAPAPAPQMCKPCEDCSAHKSRIATLEAELAACREASNRVRGAYTETLKK